MNKLNTLQTNSDNSHVIKFGADKIIVRGPKIDGNKGMTGKKHSLKTKKRLSELNKGAMKFKAEIKEIKQRKTLSIDNEYSIKLVTDDRKIMDLSHILSNQIVDVEIKEEEWDNK